MEKTAETWTNTLEVLLKGLEAEAETTERYAGALRLIEALAAKVELVETARDGKPGKETAEALATVAWSALLAREFPKALAVADRGQALLPHNFQIEGNRAHALMFTGRGEGRSRFVQRLSI